jgi:hypothetical protein
MEQGMKAIKSAVLIMSLLLVGGIALLVYGLSTRRGGHPGAGAAPEQAQAQVGPARPFGTVAVALPAGGRVAQMTVAGDRILVRVATGAGEEQIVVLDPQGGRELGRFVLDAPPAP